MSLWPRCFGPPCISSVVIFIMPYDLAQRRRHDFTSVWRKRDSRAERAKKFFYTPRFSKCTSKQIIISTEYTEIYCLFVALINTS